MKPDEYRLLTGAQIAAAVASRQVSPVEVVEACLQTIEEDNPAINAFVALDPERSLAQASRLAESMAVGGQVGLLAGVPIGVKDLDDVEGFATTFGSIPFRDNRPASDSVHVARLKAAGAIVVGKTNTPEFGYAGFTRNRVFGTTRNPWNLERTPGGSSGGSAAAVTSSMVPIATGSDGGGSIRIPASYSGCVGLKPSFGRIPRGLSPMLYWSDTESIGPLTRTITDCALYLDVTSGYHAADPDSLPRPCDSYLPIKEASRLRVGFSEDLGFARAEPQVIEQARQVADYFSSLGWEVIRLDPKLEDPARTWLTVRAVERYADMGDRLEADREEFGRAFVARVEAGRGVTAADYGEAQRQRSRLNDELAALFAKVDILLCPTTPTVAFGSEGPLPERIDGVEVEDPAEVVAYTYPFNVSGHPAISIPAGTGQDGMPIGVQLVAERHNEALIFQAARVWEQKARWLATLPPSPLGVV